MSKRLELRENVIKNIAWGIFLFGNVQYAASALFIEMIVVFCHYQLKVIPLLDERFSMLLRSGPTLLGALMSIKLLTINCVNLEH